MNIYLMFALGVVVGSIVSNFLFYFRTKRGIMRIDHSDPEKDICRIDLNGQLTNKTKRFILKVDHNAKLSDSHK